MFKGRQYCIVAGTLTLTMATGVWSHEHFDVKLIKHGATFHDSKIHGAELSGALVAGLSSAAGGAGDDIKVSGALEDVSVVQQGATWSPNEVTGQIDMQTTSQGNRCLYDPLGAIRSLRQRGDITGFNRPPDGFGVGYPNPKDDTWHWQGVQRLSPVVRGKEQSTRARRAT